MDSTDEKIIELSRKKLGLLLLGACVFVALGAWLLSLDEASIRSQRGFLLFFNDPTYARVLGLLSIVFFGICGLFAFKKLFDKKPGLVFNNFGIVDNASGVAAGLIPWSEVVGSEVFEIQKQKMLIIKVSDPQKYIERGGALRRTLNKANYKMCGSPIAIPSNALKINFSELLSLFNQYQRKYGNA
ncbi:MAG TPA: STM3941 family protein [Pyrinomonadaceae bacterium]|nr:STM3941 family protein [Pyrinomonadaceae bacterium]